MKKFNSKLAITFVSGVNTQKGGFTKGYLPFEQWIYMKLLK